MGEIAQYLQSKKARMSTAIIQYPTGKFGIVGSVPIELTRERKSFTGISHVSKVWDTEQEVIDDILSAGVTDFQLSDCTWHKRG